MKTPRYEKPQKGNPHRLTIKQHVFPKTCINRFVDARRCVDVLIKKTKRRRPAAPGDAIFCAMRAWSHREECGFMEEFEDRFQHLALEALAGNRTSSSPEEGYPISCFYALWYMRARHRMLPTQQTTVNFLTGEDLTRDQEEVLESKGVAFVGKQGTIPSRQINGIQLQMRVGNYLSQIAHYTWGVITAEAGEFLVPDIPCHTIIPLTPKLALVGNTAGGVVTVANLCEINYAMASMSNDYFFARDLTKCPMMRRF